MFLAMGGVEYRPVGGIMVTATCVVTIFQVSGITVKEHLR